MINTGHNDRTGYAAFKYNGSKRAFSINKPNTLSRLLLAQGTSMVSPRGCQAYGTQGSKVKPDSSK
jgi:hypothetical protein